MQTIDFHAKILCILSELTRKAKLLERVNAVAYQQAWGAIYNTIEISKNISLRALDSFPDRLEDPVYEGHARPPCSCSDYLLRPFGTRTAEKWGAGLAVIANSLREKLG